MKTINRHSSSTALTHHAQKAIDATSSLLPQWLSTGAALSLTKAGTKVATKLVRRNPAAAVAIGVVGVGVLAYRMYRRRAVVITDSTGEAIPDTAIEGSPLQVHAVREVALRTEVNPKPALSDV